MTKTEYPETTVYIHQQPDGRLTVGTDQKLDIEDMKDFLICALAGLTGNVIVFENSEDGDD